MTVAPSVPVRDAVILAAGNGDRFQNSTRESKLLQRVLGQPLIIRTVTGAVEAGITRLHVVVGYQAERVRAVIEAGAPRGVALTFTLNPDWHLENGVSARAVGNRLSDRRFALLMGDHLFEPHVLEGLLRAPARADESLLAVDVRPALPQVAAEATKVQLAGDRIVAIGKDLDRYDALDTGLFVCAPPLFGALDEARQAGDTTLSGGIRRLAARGLMRAHDIGDAGWYDIDTVDDLESAEAILALPEHV
ncbi:MAG TPA: NTP transferase domain-containing protein [Vicinamibacterales bacterium]